MANIKVNEGTQTPIATDTVGTVQYGIVKLDYGAAGASSPFTGTILEVSKVASGTVSINTPGTITSGTVSVNTPGTITSGSIAVTAGTITSGSIVVTTGTVVNNGGTAGTVTGVGVVTTLTNLSNGTIQNSGTTTGVGVVTNVTNLLNGTIQNSGTTTGVGVVTTVTNLSNGTIQNSGTTTGVGTVSGMGVLTTLTNLANGTIQNSGTTTGVGTVSAIGQVHNAGTIQTIVAGTVTNVGTVPGIGVVSNITNGSIVVTAGTVNGNVASGTTDSGNPVKIGGKYNLSAPTLTDGYRGDAQLDVNGLLKVREGYGPGYENNVDGVANVLQKPVSSSTYAPSDYTNFGAVPGTNVKGSAGNIYSVHVTSIANAITYFQLFNASSAVPNGATPVASYAMGSVTSGGVAELKLDSTHFAPSKYFSTGISFAMSSTNGTLGTASITASNHNVHIKYV